MLRKQWLFITVINYLFPFATAAMAQIALMSNSGVAMQGIWLSIVAAFGVVVLSIWAIIHCAYRRYGTKYLTGLLIAGPLVIVLFMLIGLTKANPQIAGVVATSFTSSLFVFITSLISMGIYVWWYILSLKLRKLNKGVRREVYAALQGSSLPREHLSAFAL